MGSVVFVGRWVSVRGMGNPWFIAPNFHRYSEGNLDDLTPSKTRKLLINDFIKLPCCVRFLTRIGKQCPDRSNKYSAYCRPLKKCSQSSSIYLPGNADSQSPTLFWKTQLIRVYHNLQPIISLGLYLNWVYIVRIMLLFTFLSWMAYADIVIFTN